MVTEEIYILTKHAKFGAEYAENIPVYKRRFFLDLLQKENEMIEEERKKQERKYNRK
jgi:hypothetical protein